MKDLGRADPILAGLMDAVGPFGLQLTGAPETFAALARSIVYQQLNGRAAGAIYARVRALFPGTGDMLRPENILGASDEELLGAGLSRAKLLAMRDLARRAADGAIPTLAETRSMDDESIIEELIEVRGIGRWSAQMFLIFTLGTPRRAARGRLRGPQGFRAHLPRRGRCRHRRSFSSTGSCGGPTAAWPAGTSGGRSNWTNRGSPSMSFSPVARLFR